jgi:serine/threonine protein kinase
MTTVTTIRDYCALLRKSKLLSAEDIETYYRKWRDDTGGTEDQVDRFRKFLVTQRVVTEWQAALIQRGRADGFFLDGYKILDRIGKGQMGGVYKAVHTLGQLVAVKILPASKAKDQHLLGRFQREARLLLQLNHPNVVRAFQLGESNGVHYIVMEYLEGETLDETLARRKQLPWAEAVRLVHQALCGLQHLHERRMVHRDLKPANLMLVPAPTTPDTTWDATLKILDIGLGRELFSDDVPAAQIETQLTVEGTVLGTPDYLAPEQAKDARSSDIRADIYSLGCVLYQCLAGRLPFPETNLMTQMLKHATEKPPPITTFAPDVPLPLLGVVDRLMAKLPEQRYPTPATAAEALAPFLAANGAIPAPAAVVPAFQKWLETESHLQVPEFLPDPRATGTAPAPIGGPLPGSGAVPPAATASRPVPVAPPRPPAGFPPPQPPGVLEEVDVELVPESMLASANPLPLPDNGQPEQRPVWDLDRRDWVMLTAGAAGVLAAVGLGYALARLARKKPPEEPEPSP